MICSKCGTKVKDGTKFCPKCGSMISAGSQMGLNHSPGYGTYLNPGKYADPDRGKGEAIASLVLGIVSVICWFFGYSALISVICGVIGLILASKSKQLGYTGGMRTAGFVLSLIGLIGGALVFAACVACTGIGLGSLNTLEQLMK